MTALAAVATYIPPLRVPIRTLRDSLGITNAELKVFERYFGLAQIALEPDGTLADLLYNAASRLPDLDAVAGRIRYVVHGRSMPVVAPYPAAALPEVRERLGLTHALDFTVTQHACASGLLALEVAGRLLDGCGDPDALALVLTGEKVFTAGARMIPRTTIMGEAGAACLVRPGGDRDRLLAYAADLTTGYQSPELAAKAGRPAGLPQRSRSEYHEQVAAILLTAVKRAGLVLDEVALVLPHNVNVISWERVCELVGLPGERVLLANVPRTGHAFCADAFVNYRTAVDGGALCPGDHYVMVAVGTGMTFSALVLRH